MDRWLGGDKYFHSVTLSLRKKRSGTYRFSFAITPKILIPAFFKELRWKYSLRIKNDANLEIECSVGEVLQNCESNYIVGNSVLRQKLFHIKTVQFQKLNVG